jgi:hypothetical protein
MHEVSGIKKHPVARILGAHVQSALDKGYHADGATAITSKTLAQLFADL